MKTHVLSQSGQNSKKGKFVQVPLFLLAPVPLATLQPILRRIVRKVARERPELFERLGVHRDKRFLIDAINLPFAFLLRPHPEHPELVAYRRNRLPDYDAAISGTFLALMCMMDGQLDGDALFFNRRLKIEGDVEAVVVLRNAMDDLDGSVAEDLASALGAPGIMMLRMLRKMGKELHGRE